METTNTQVQQPGAVNPAEAPKPEANGSAPGVEARIGELTAKLRSMEESYAKSQDQLSSALAMLAEQAVRGQNAQPAQPAVEVAPEDQARINAILQPQLQRLEQMQAQLARRFGMAEFQQAAVREDPRVVARANELLAQWQRARLTGWSEKDALVYARGEVLGSDSAKNATAAAARNGFNQMTQTIPGSNGVPVLQSQDAIPADLAKWSLEKQAEFWEKRAGDREF